MEGMAKLTALLIKGVEKKAMVETTSAYCLTDFSRFSILSISIIPSAAFSQIMAGWKSKGKIINVQRTGP